MLVDNIVCYRYFQNTSESITTSVIKVMYHIEGELRGKNWYRWNRQFNIWWNVP